MVSLPNHTFTGQAKSSKQLTSIVHILSTDNCPSWISRRERMTRKYFLVGSWEFNQDHHILWVDLKCQCFWMSRLDCMLDLLTTSEVPELSVFYHLHSFRGVVKEDYMYLMIILGQFSLVLHNNIFCEYSLEAPHRGASNEYSQNMLLWRNKRKYPIIIACTPP